MAAPVYIVTTALTELRRLVGDLDTTVLEPYYADVLTRHTQQDTTTYRFRSIGGGYWRVALAAGASIGTFALGSPTFTSGANDHIYITGALGNMRALAVVRTVGTCTAQATGANTTNTLTASASNFTGGTAVAVGNFVVLSSGAVAEILEVTDATHLVTSPLPAGKAYTAGTTFYIGSAPGSDTTTEHQVTAYNIDFRAAHVEVLTRLLDQYSLRTPLSIGGTVEDVQVIIPTIRQRIQDVLGVGYYC